MRADKRGTRVTGVIKTHCPPAVHGMALVTSERKSGRAVIEGFRVVIVLGVAGTAGDGKARVLGGGGSSVTCFAVHRGMRADEREAGGVVPNGLNTHLPSSDVVALIAAGAELPAMDVGVAVRAPEGSLAEEQIGVALAAGDPLVHAAKRIACFGIVVEFTRRS
jgi:hypothetical protein